MSSLQVLPKTTNSNSGGATEPQCRYNASVYRDENGEVAGVFAAARDVTQRRRTEAELALHQPAPRGNGRRADGRSGEGQRGAGGRQKELKSFAYRCRTICARRCARSMASRRSC